MSGDAFVLADANSHHVGEFSLFARKRKERKKEAKITDFEREMRAEKKSGKKNNQKSTTQQVRP